MKQQTKPRVSHHFSVPDPGVVWPDGTWLECESFSYTGAGGGGRKAMAKLPNRRKMLVVLRLPNCFHMLPAYYHTAAGKLVSGYVTTDKRGVKFHTKEQ